LRLRNVVVVLGLGVLAALIPVVVAVAPARAATDPQAAESAFVAKINALRASKGLGTLRVDGELTAIARRWAAKMAADGDIAHNPSFSKQVTADWVKLGENVGMGPDVDALHDAFVASPTHYKNLVDGDFQLVGVGVVVAADGTLFTSHQFERLADAPAAPVAAPAPAPKPVAAPKPAPAPRPSRPAAAPKPAPAPVAAPAAPAVPAAPPQAVQVLETLRTFARPAA
jgi:hypothetical protein